LSSPLCAELDLEDLRTISVERRSVGANIIRPHDMCPCVGLVSGWHRDSVLDSPLEILCTPRGRSQRDRPFFKQ
jgi:hypothetical protein